MKKSLFRFGYLIGMALTYLCIVALSPIFAAIVVYDRWQNLDLSNVTFANFGGKKKS